MSHDTRDLGMNTGINSGKNKYIELAEGKFITAIKQEKFKYKAVKTMENPSFLSYITCYWNQTCAIEYFPLLR